MEGLDLRISAAGDVLDDEGVLEDLVKQINERYTATEHELWQAGKDFKRTKAAELLKLREKGQLILAFAAVERVPVGSVCIVALSESSPAESAWAELGMLAVRPTFEGRGIGAALIAKAKSWAKDHQRAELRLEILHPRKWSHPYKDRLRAWYLKLGFTIVQDAPFEEQYPELVASFKLACVCDALLMSQDASA